MARRMRVLYVLDRFPVLSETFVADEVRGLLRAGDDVTVYARSGGEDGVADKLRELMVGPGMWPPRRGLRAALALRERGSVHALAQAAWLARRVRADHVHAHFAFGAASIALLYGRLTGTPASFTAHAYDLYGAVPDGVLARKIAAAAWAAAPTEHGAARLRACAAPADREKVVVQRMGVARAALAAGAPEEPARVVVVGRLVEKKGLDVLARAAARLDPAVVVEIVGDGPQRGRLEQLAEGRVRFAGALPHAQALARLRGASVFALPCRELASGDRDGLPVALVEAMAAGVPVVTTPVAGIPELVRDGATGLLVEPGDEAALAGAIARLLADGALRDRLAGAGRAATEPWDMAACIAQLRARFS
jgi:colanic acid/amylovoran biosynthesis glycosyltransferase